jgi:hypothetical protein
MAMEMRPLGAVEPGQVLEYLLRQGMTKEIVRWKYFDRSPLPDHVQGLVAVRDKHIAGFIGLIPFTTTHGLRAAWTCDWFAEASAGASGIALLSACLKSYEAIYQLGGNERTQAILSRLAKRTIRGAGIEYRLPLRLGAHLDVLRRRAGLRFPAAVERIPLRRRRAAGKEATIRTGIAPELAHITDGRYALDYLEWQIGRCPAVSCYTCLTAGAAILLWTPRNGKGFWRMAPFVRDGSPDAVRAALAVAIRHVHDLGGLRIAVLLSHRDEFLRKIVAAHGFAVARERRMMNVLARPDSIDAAVELTEVSFLDSDMAYRF